MQGGRRTCKHAAGETKCAMPEYTCEPVILHSMKIEKTRPWPMA